MTRIATDNHMHELLEQIAAMPLAQKVAAINDLKRMIHDVSPFKDEPVDCVLWIASENITANEYNPNKVAPPEMELLEVSIVNDGYTQPTGHKPMTRDPSLEEIWGTETTIGLAEMIRLERPDLPQNKGLHRPSQIRQCSTRMLPGGRGVLRGQG